MGFDQLSPNKPSEPSSLQENLGEESTEKHRSQTWRGGFPTPKKGPMTTQKRCEFGESITVKKGVLVWCLMMVVQLCMVALDPGKEGCI